MNHTSRTRRKYEARTREILDTAARLFAERGYHATRMQDIADVLDMHKASLYYYSASKEALLMQIVEDRVENALVGVRPVLESNKPVEERLHLGIQEHLRRFQQQADIFSIFSFEKLNVINREAAASVDRIGREYELLWCGFLQEGIRAGVFRNDLDVKLLVKAIMGMCNLTLTWYNPNGRLGMDAIADVFASFALDGLRK